MGRSFLEKVFPIAVCGSGLNRAAAIRYRGRGVIFMLHSVTDDASLHIDQGIRCSVTKLTQILRQLREQDVEFVTIDDAIERLKEPASASFAAFTFDDGYADTLTRALPVMEHFQAPFTVYVTTSMITRELDAWWLGLAALLASRDKVEVRQFGWIFHCPNLATKRQAFRKIELFVRGNPSILPYIRELVRENGIDCTALAAREALSVRELRTLTRHPLVTIGAHAISHGHLSGQPVETVLREMIGSRCFLEEVTGSSIAHFAYPFGNEEACGEREATLAREAGFRTAVTTRRGTLFPQHLEHLHALPREPLSGEETRYSLRCKVDGMYRAVHSR